MLGTLPGVVFLEERGCLQDPRSKQALRGLPRGLQPNPEARFHSSLAGEPLTPSRERTLSWSRDDLVQLPWPWNLSRLGVMGNLGDVPWGATPILPSWEQWRRPRGCLTACFWLTSDIRVRISSLGMPGVGFHSTAALAPRLCNLHEIYPEFPAGPDPL